MSDKEFFEQNVIEIQYGPQSNLETLKVAPLKVGKIPAFIRAIRPALDSFINQAPSPTGDGTEVDLDILNLIAEHGECLIEGGAIATGQSVEFIGEGDAAQFAELIHAIFTVNSDFFAKKAMPQLLKVKASNGAGEIASST